MTTPVTADDLVAGCTKMLQAHPDVLAVLGEGLFNGELKPLLFQYALRYEMEGTGSTAAVISVDGGWAGPNLHNTMRFPRLVLQVYADPMRYASGQVSHPVEVQRRVMHAYEVIDSWLHRPEGGVQMWGTVRTIACARMVEPSVYPVPDGDGLLRLVVSYGVTQG